MSLKLKPLAEQVIVITGASSGIGLVTARRAAAAGAKVVMVARSGETLAREAQEIGATHFVADVGDAAAVRAAADHAVATYGRIDSWVNNAGVTIYAPLMETPDDEHQRLFQTNYFGAVHGCRAAVPHLREGGGALITVSSIVAELPTAVMGAYAASKHAVKAYVESLRIELKGDSAPICVTLIKPSGIDTPIGQHAANHMGEEGRIPPPAYAPELVADAILSACERPQRELTVGGIGRAQVLFGVHLPRVFELLTPLLATTFTDKKRAPTPGSNLHAASEDDRERSGLEVAKPFSLYTSAAKRPGLTALVAGVALAGGLLALSGSTRRRNA